MLERAMGVTVSLLGSQYYGQRDFHADGSFTTTRWLAALYIPLIPLGSYRAVPAWPTGQRHQLGIVARAQACDYELQPCARSGRQVAYVYGFVLLLAIWFFLIIKYLAPRIIGSLDFLIGIPILMVIAVLPLPIPWFLRYAARKKMRAA